MADPRIPWISEHVLANTCTIPVNTAQSSAAVARPADAPETAGSTAPSIATAYPPPNLLGALNGHVAYTDSVRRTFRGRTNTILVLAATSTLLGIVGETSRIAPQEQAPTGQAHAPPSDIVDLLSQRGRVSRSPRLGRRIVRASPTSSRPDCASRRLEIRVVPELIVSRCPNLRGQAHR